MNTSNAGQFVHARGAVYFEDASSIEQAGLLLTQHVFGGIRFEQGDPGLREDIPCYVLEREVLGMSAVLYGIEGKYVLEVNAGKFLYKKVTPGCLKLELGKWISQVLDTIPIIVVTAYSPLK